MKSKYARWSFSHLLAIIMIVAAGSAFAAGETLMHNSDNLGTTYGTWGVAGGTYGQFTCSTCHTKTTTNVMRVVESIPNTIGPNANKSVMFNNMTAFGDDSVVRTTSFRICEVCHTQTKYHRYDNTAQPGGQGHPNGDCTQCHPHADGFKATGCTSCHGHNATSDSPIATGNHTAHINNAGTIGVNYSCADCHAPTVSSDTTFSNAANHNNGTKNYGGTRAGTFNAGTCTATCHTDGKGGPAATAVNWTTGPALTCKGCHGGASSTVGEPVYASGAAGSATANNHPKHVAATGGAASCQNCHGATMNGSALNASGKHTDMTIDVLQGNNKTFGYTDASKTCSNISCHGNGFFTPADAQWGAALDCAGCHTSSAVSALGKHAKHLSPTIASAFNCGNCHADTATNSTTLKAGTITHMNAAKEVKFDTNNGSGSFDGTNCSNIYCHSYGTTLSGPFKVKTVASWSGAAVNCYSCHGSDSTTGLYNNMSTGRHKKHMVGQYTYGCATCHAATVSNNTTISDVSKHVNVQIDVSFSGVATTGGAAATYALNGHAPGATGTVDQSCNNIYCHSNAQTGGQVGTTHRFRNLTGAKRFNQTTTVSLGCNGCHSTGSTISGSWTLSGAHLAHLSLSVNPQIGKVLACNDCHANGGTNLNRANHANGIINYSSALGGSSARGNLKLSTGRCNTVYCHSNGQGVYNNMSTVAWFSGAKLGCNGCHANAANASSLSGAHNAHINGGTTGGSFNCKDCHASTLNVTFGSSTTINASGNHVNTLKNFSGAKAYKTGYVAGGACSTYCHTDGRGTAVAPPLWVSGTNLDCGGCHGKDAASMTSNRHAEHLTKGATCANCHNSTTTNGTQITGSVHIDGSVELQQGGSFSSKAVEFAYAGGGTCNNISCHSPYASPYSNTASWNAATPATCDTCHPKAGLSGAHRTHMGALDLTSASIYYNMTANRSPAQDESVGRTYGFGCGTCHPMTTANHLNGTIDVDLNRVNVAGVGTLRFLNHSTAGYTMGSTKKCSNIYCHSNASRIEAESNAASNTSLAWNDTYAAHPELDRCAQCHGNQPTTGAHAAHSVGLHTFNDGVMLDGNIYNGVSGKLPITNKPNTAHGNPNNSTTIGCYICHNATVTSKANDRNTKCSGCHYAGNPRGAQLKGVATVANLANHVNGMRDVQFAPIQMRSKAQVRPKGANTASNSGFDFYSGVWQRTSYKAYSTLSYDIAKAAFDTATMWHPGTAMNSNCSNIACHNGRTVSWNLANFNDPNKCMDCHNAL